MDYSKNFSQLVCDTYWKITNTREKELKGDIWYMHLTSNFKWISKAKGTLRGVRAICIFSHGDMSPIDDELHLYKTDIIESISPTQFLFFVNFSGYRELHTV